MKPSSLPSPKSHRNVLCSWRLSELPGLERLIVPAVRQCTQPFRRMYLYIMQNKGISYMYITTDTILSVSQPTHAFPQAVWQPNGGVTFRVRGIWVLRPRGVNGLHSCRFRGSGCGAVQDRVLVDSKPSALNRTSLMAACTVPCHSLRSSPKTHGALNPKP